MDVFVRQLVYTNGVFIEKVLKIIDFCRFSAFFLLYYTKVTIFQFKGVSLKLSPYILRPIFIE